MPLTPRQIRALSVEADVCPATVQRRLAGLPLRPSTAARLDSAAVALALRLPAAVLASPSGGRSPGTPLDTSPPTAVNATR